MSSAFFAKGTEGSARPGRDSGAVTIGSDTAVNVTSDAALTDEAIARFHRVGFMVVTGLTTLEDLEVVSRLLAGLYPRSFLPPVGTGCSG